MCCKCGVTQRKVWVFGCGTLIALIALILGLLWPTLYMQYLHSQLVLKKDSLSYNNWIETPIPMYLKIYLFNWENPEDIKKPDVKPRFKEMGPYVFEEKHTRVDLDWHDNSTISFNQIRTWHFLPEKSKGTLDDKVTSLNVIAATVPNMVRDKPKAIKIIANYMLNKKGGSFTVTKTVKEWLFDGYDDELLTFIKSLHSPTINIPFNKFGWFVERNGSKTYDGRFNMYTGEADILQLGILNTWNGENKTRYYKYNCSNVKGTTGELWPPELSRETPKVIFVTDICRYITLQPQQNVMKHEISGYEWIADDQVFDNGIHYHSSSCFCSADNSSECLKAGVQDISECRYGAPVAVSYPHFYLADPSYLKAVEGLKANDKDHQTTLSLETYTGIPLEVNARLQINLHLQPFKEFDLYKDVPRVMMPLFWFEETAALDDGLAKQVKMAAELPAIGTYTAYGLGALGVLVILIGVILTVTKSWKRPPRDDEVILTN